MELNMFTNTQDTGRTSKWVNLILASAIVIVCLFGVAKSLVGCDTPVYQYALERWPSGVYTVFVFHDGELTEEQTAMIEGLQARCEAPKPLSMPEKAPVEDEATEGEAAEGEATEVESGEIEMPYGYMPYPFADVVTIDVSDPPERFSEALVEAWAEKAADGPIIVIPHPLDYSGEYSLWDGALTQENIDLLVDSPLRKELTSRLLNNGDAIVWLFLPCGDEEKDTQAKETLDAELKRLRKMMLESGELWPLSGIPTPGEDIHEWMVPRFSILEIDPDAAEEAFVISSLLRSEPGLDELTDQPMVFPTFGRGRVVFGLVGDGITTENIEQTCYYLTGPCSCQIKDANPGMDLLTSVEWDASIYIRMPVREEALRAAHESSASSEPLMGLGSIADSVGGATEEDPTPGANEEAPAPQEDENGQEAPEEEPTVEEPAVEEPEVKEPVAKKK
jgi:hypothetical protein